MNPLAALLILCTVVPACSRNPSTTAKDEAPIRSLTLYTFEDYYDESVIKTFENKYQLSVDIQTYENTDEMLQKMKSNAHAYDVVIMDDYGIRRAAALRLIRPLIKEKLPNFSNNGAEYLDKSFDPKNRYSMPYTWGTTLIAYRKDMISDVEDSWQILFNPAYKGKICLLDDRLENFSFSLRSLGYDMNTESPTEIAEATERLVDLVSKNKAMIASDAEGKQHLTDGTSWISMMYSGDAALIAEESESDTIGFFIPREGTSVWIDSFTISRDSRAIDEAHAFINYMADAEAAAKNAGYLKFATPNKAALSHLDPTLRDDRRIYPDQDVQAKCGFLSDGTSVRTRAINEGWAHVVRSLDSEQPSVSTTVGADAEGADE